MVSSPDPNEWILKQGKARIRLGGEVVSGVLALTTRRLVFQPNDRDTREPLQVFLHQIQSVEKRLTRVLGFLPLLPTSIAVTVDEGEYRVVVIGRREWITAIDDQRAVVEEE